MATHTALGIQELVDFIIELVGPYDIKFVSPAERRDLRAYSLVAKSWVAACQRFLFNNIEISLDQRGAKRWTNLHSALTASPRAHRAQV